DAAGGPPTVLVYRRVPRGHSKRLNLTQGWKYTAGWSVFASPGRATGAQPNAGASPHRGERIAHQRGSPCFCADRPSDPLFPGGIRVSDVDMSLRRVADM
ncbi:hypothetical protein AB0E88_35750, partial [Streptomyces sp. NPDC028635]